MTPEQMAQTLDMLAAEYALDANETHDSLRAEFQQQSTALAAGAAALRRGTCGWREYEECWNGSCGVKWVLTDGTPAENGMHFCPRCGRHLMPEQTTTPVSAGLPCHTGGEWWKGRR